MLFLMCGRYGLIDMKKLKRRFQTRNDKQLEPRYNIAPGQELPVVVNAGEHTLELMKWGLIPFWAKDDSKCEYSRPWVR